MSDFSSWASPPATHRPELQWDHNGWNKLGGGKYVYTREVQESFLDCVGIWPLLDEAHGVPKLLDRANFFKYCYYVSSKEEFQADDHPEEYVPMDFEKDRGSREEWRERQVRERFNEQYFDTSIFDALDFMLSDEERRAKKSKPDVKSKKNQYYIKAVKSCRPDGIRALFDKGTEELSPNCLEVAPREKGNMRRGVVYHALNNLYRDTGSSGSRRSKAMACLRLVCSLEGVDVNADTWFTTGDVGPPLVVAVKKFDAEAVKILLDAGARPTFPDVIGVNGQWCNLVRPSEYPDAYQTACHVCVGCIKDETRDEDVRDVLKLLLEAGSEGDVLVEMPLDRSDSGHTATALQILEVHVESSGKEYPLSMAVLQEAEAKAGRAGQNVKSEEDKPANSPTGLMNGDWAKLTDLDETAQTSISEFMDFSQWARLKQTSKSLRSWPMPPSPPVEYHLIRFCFSDGRYTACFGFAKTLSAVLEAFKHMVGIHTPQDLPSYYSTLDHIAFQFIHIKDIDQPVIPLLQYRQEEDMNNFSVEEISHIHPDGKVHFGVEYAGEGLPKTDMVTSTNQEDTCAWVMQDGDDEDYKCYQGISFDDPDVIDAFISFKGKEPSKDINLRHLWHVDGKFSNEGGEQIDMYEIWINKEEADDGKFRYGDGDSWAVCTSETHLWDT